MQFYFMLFRPKPNSAPQWWCGQPLPATIFLWRRTLYGLVDYKKSANTTKMNKKIVTSCFKIGKFKRCQSANPTPWKKSDIIVNLIKGMALFYLHLCKIITCFPYPSVFRYPSKNASKSFCSLSFCSIACPTISAGFISMPSREASQLRSFSNHSVISAGLAA